jgi:hypothetical protein
MLPKHLMGAASVRVRRGNSRVKTSWLENVVVVYVAPLETGIFTLR